MTAAQVHSGQKLAGDQILELIISPIDDNRAVIQDGHPLAADWKSYWHEL
jgi:hypothetical protein